MTTATYRRRSALVSIGLVLGLITVLMHPGRAGAPPLTCPDDLLISNYQTTPSNAQFVDVTNVGTDPISLDGCSLVTFNVFTEKSIGAATKALSGTLFPGETQRVTSFNGAMPAGPGAVGIYDITPPPADGSPFTTDHEITGMVYLDTNGVFAISHLTEPAHNAIYDAIYGGSGQGPFTRPFDDVAAVFNCPAGGHPTQVYEDNDGDGFGDPALPHTACADTVVVTDNTDCDDTNDAINPGATEVLGDGVDNDCDGLNPDDCRCTGDYVAFLSLTQDFTCRSDDGRGICIYTGNNPFSNCAGNVIGINQQPSNGIFVVDFACGTVGNGDFSRIEILPSNGPEVQTCKEVLLAEAQAKGIDCPGL